MNEFILNDMQIAKTNGSTAHEMLPAGMLTECEHTHLLFLSVSHLLIYTPSLWTVLYTDVTIVDVS